MKEIKGGVCAAKGFMAGGIRCGIKPGNSNKKDLALIFSLKPCTAAAVFTKNKVQAACIQVSKENIARCADGKMRAVIVNSGNANACTGDEGLSAAKRMAFLASKVLEVDEREVAVASTGVIGVPLPINVIVKNINVLKASLRDDGQGHADALEAIMTTDTRKKETAFEIEIGGKTVRIGAMAKGSGMIHPDMATMLAFITTDAAISSEALDKCLRKAVNNSFNRLTVDGDTSTNDMVLIMANGEAGNEQLTTDGGHEDLKKFESALEVVCISLAKMIARDGEGATKLISVKLEGASCEKTALSLAKSVASSSLVKAACFGADANWGRVLCAMGYAGVDFSPEKTDVCFSSRAGDITVCKSGKAFSFSEEKAKQILSEEEIEIRINMNDGESIATVWGCDLTYDYVKINGDYRS